MEKTQHRKINIMFMKVEKLDLVNVIEIFFNVIILQILFHRLTQTLSIRISHLTNSIVWY
jgi:hypothetical protein